MKALHLLFAANDPGPLPLLAAGQAVTLVETLPDYLRIDIRAAGRNPAAPATGVIDFMVRQGIQTNGIASEELSAEILTWADLVVVLGSEPGNWLPAGKQMIHWPLKAFKQASGSSGTAAEAAWLRALGEDLGRAVRGLYQALLVDYLDAVNGSVFGRSDVEILSRSREHEGFIPVDRVHLRHRLYAGGWSETIQREVADRNPAVGVLLYDPLRDEVVLVKQFRAGALDDHNSPWLLEIVAGIAGDDEDPLDVAKREALEEANCRVDDLVPVCRYFNSPGWSNEEIHLFCARVDAGALEGIHGLDDEHEDILVVTVSREQAQGFVQQGDINNAMAVIAIQWLALNHQDLKSQWQAGG